MTTLAEMKRAELKKAVKKYEERWSLTICIGHEVMKKYEKRIRKLLEKESLEQIVKKHLYLKP